MKKIVSLLLCVLLISSLCGCKKTQSTTESSNNLSTNNSSSESDSTKNDASSTITITDHNDDTVTLPGNIERIVVCDILPLPSVLSVFFDSASKIVGMSEPSMTAAKNSLLSELYPEIVEAKTDFINGSEVNVEELMKLKPDVVFYNASSSELRDQLRNAGFNAVAISVNKWDYNCIETLNQWIDLLSQMFPDNDKAETVKNYSNEIYEKIQAKVANLSEADRARVFFLFKYSDASIMTSGKLFFGQWWADAIGAVNVANELTKDNSVAVNLEQIYTWNPDTIFMTNFNQSFPDDLYNNTVGNYDWSGITAVQQKQVYKMPLGMYRSYTPGVDTPITLLWLAKTTYPELFADTDITQSVKDYYKTVFNIDLTDEQANSIFSPVADAAVGF